MTCPECGSEESGRYCSECGSRLERPDDSSTSSLVSRLPWILSGLAVLAFAVGAVLLVQERVRPRTEGAPLTGEIPGMEGGGEERGAGEAGAPAGGEMPSAEELGRMGPREAGDRLFDRAMRLDAAGSERAEFFAEMGLRAYGGVPPEELDADARFHAGLLRLVLGQADSAAAQAERILSEEQGNLLGLYLAARAAAEAGDTARARERMRRLRAALEAADLSARPEYEAHRRLLEEAAAGGEIGAEGGG